MILNVIGKKTCGDAYRDEFSRIVLCSGNIQCSIVVVNNMIKKDALEHEKRKYAALGPTSAQRWQGNSYLPDMPLGDCVPLKVGVLLPNYHSY